MMLSGDSSILSRRRLLLVAGGAVAAAGRLGASRGDFWESKPPAEWTSEEVDRLLTKSPWAKAVTAQYAPGEGGRGPGDRGQDPDGGGYPGGGYPGGGGGYPGGGGGYPGGGGGYPGGGYPGGGGGYPGGMGRPRIGIGGIPGIGGVGGRGRGRQGGPRSSASSYTGTVRWQSAIPILEATKSTLPAAFEGHYVIAVAGIPWLRNGAGRGSQTGDEGDRSPDPPDHENFDELKQFTTLTPKGRELAQAGVVQRQLGGGTVLLFGFSREILPLTLEDKRVEFATRLGMLEIKTAFELKEMVYRGHLAV